jgi:hypothetical protein
MERRISVTLGTEREKGWLLSCSNVVSETQMELIEIAGVIALSVAVSLAGARAILTASLFLMMRGVATVTAEVQDPVRSTRTV